MSVKFDDFFTPISDSKNPDVEFDDFFTPVKEQSRLKSLGSALAKGVIKGAQSISPLPKLGPVPEKLGLRVTEEMLPSKKELPEELLERGGKLATFLASGEGGLVSKGARAGIGAVLGQTTKELGGGQIAQDIAELGSMGLPDISKAVPVKKAQERVVSFLRGKGFSENEITPLLQSPKKLARFAKFASKGEKTNKLMRDIYGKFDNVYSSIRDEGGKLGGLKDKQIDSFLDEFQTQMDKIPKFYKRQIKEEVDDLLNSELKFNDFMDFDQAVNARIKGIEGGKAVLGTLKKATGNSKKAISPELSNDLNLANELYGKRADVSKHLRTKEIDDLLDLGEIGGLLGGIADQNAGLIAKVLGVTGARKLSQEILINPRLQNISKRMFNAIKKNKIPVAQKLYEIFKEEAIKKDKKFEEILL